MPSPIRPYNDSTSSITLSATYCPMLIAIEIHSHLAIVKGKDTIIFDLWKIQLKTTTPQGNFNGGTTLKKQVHAF